MSGWTSVEIADLPTAAMYCSYVPSFSLDPDPVDLLGPRVLARVVDVGVDVPVDAPRVAVAAEAGRAQDEGDRVAGVRLVLAIAGVAGRA